LCFSLLPRGLFRSEAFRFGRCTLALRFDQPIALLGCFALALGIFNPQSLKPINLQFIGSHLNGSNHLGKVKRHHRGEKASCQTCNDACSIIADQTIGVGETKRRQHKAAIQPKSRQSEVQITRQAAPVTFNDKVGYPRYAASNGEGTGRGRGRERPLPQRQADQGVEGIRLGIEYILKSGNRGENRWGKTIHDEIRDSEAPITCKNTDSFCKACPSRLELGSAAELSVN
jgi:hypothetical protein